MELLIVSFIAGLLTVLAPCILPLLPVIIGGTLEDTKSKSRPFVITASLAASVMFFTLLLRGTTAFIEIPDSFWKYLSGGLILAIGLFMLFPMVWESLSAKLNLNAKSNKLLGKSAQSKSWFGPVLIGAALGPVFISCSPTYAIVLATVLPENFARGFVFLLSYVLGLAVVMLALSLLGQRLVSKLQWATDPRGWFKRTIGVLFIVVGLAVMTGYDKKFETWLIDQGVYDRIAEFEQNLLGD